MSNSTAGGEHGHKQDESPAAWRPGRRPDRRAQRARLAGWETPLPPRCASGPNPSRGRSAPLGGALTSTSIRLVALLTTRSALSGSTSGESTGDTAYECQGPVAGAK